MNEPTDAVIGPVIEIKARLVKWDGEPPDDADPMGHPQCIEIIDIQDGEARTVYRRATI